ncbi:SDR family oxidoreductase [Alienimonas chondri]|uniref:3-oxoacyl-[acyl-carrier-protein] reductase FabG n=1 Tax=Alienimonas chondri TaxID=2681879 RepID=A0ABX1VD09_9PLAN|nr:SDR family oxidoreductase [Alienimonas chondri]NNJ25400.1 3-oxoacyl-[acyl-carrier-protein] reductase FabG [Alienimonas chondri]
MSDPKLIALTGCTRGIGRALAERFAAEGHVICGCGRSEERLNELRAVLRPPHRFARVDVTREDQVDRWSDAVFQEAGVPDLLIHNAGLINDVAPLWKVSAARCNAVLAVSVGAGASLARHFLPRMIDASRTDSRNRTVVMFSSGWGRSASAGVAPYNAAKFGVEGMTKALAQDLEGVAPGRFCAVPFSPGVVETDMTRGNWGEEAESFADPADFAERAVPFLLGLTPEQTGESVTVPDAA